MAPFTNPTAGSTQLSTSLISGSQALPSLSAATLVFDSVHLSNFLDIANAAVSADTSSISIRISGVMFASLANSVMNATTQSEPPNVATEKENELCDTVHNVTVVKVRKNAHDGWRTADAIADGTRMLIRTQVSSYAKRVCV